MNDTDLFENITTFIFDVDGVLTDGTVLVLENGLQARRMSIKDGYALQLAIKKKYHLLVVSGAAVSPVIDRLHKLGITDVFMGIGDKRTFISHYIANHGISAGQVLYMGDDIPDLPAMKLVGLPVCPSDAVQEVRDAAKYISPAFGGRGCVRDVIEKVLKAQNNWQHSDDLTSR